MGIPEHLIERQRAVEAEIRVAFHGTRRAGGVSWSESHEVDNYEGPEKRAEARAKDTERCWEDLVDDPKWEDEVGVGGFNFLDAIGFAYYIAPAMIRCARRGGGWRVPQALSIEDDRKRNLARLVDGRRARAVAGFLRFMTAVNADGPSWELSDDRRNAYEGYWQQFEAPADEAGNE